MLAENESVGSVFSSTYLLREQIYDFILRTGAAGVTDEEICWTFDLLGDSVRPRRNELVQANLVDKSRVRRRTTCGRTAIVWMSTRVLDKLAKNKLKR